MIRFIFIFVLMPLSVNVISQERLAFFQLNYTNTLDSCRLIEKGSAIREHYFVFSGEKDRLNNYCIVPLTRQEFASSFSFCALSAVDHRYHGQGACSFEPNGDGYVFLAGVPGIEDKGIYTQQCDFVCLAVSEGNRSKERLDDIVDSHK